MKSLRQVVPHRLWPNGDGWTVAILSRSPEQLAASHGLSFEEGFDDLDLFDLAALDCPEIGQLWLFRHRQSPEAGVEVIVDTGVERNAALAALLASGVASQDSLVWTTDDARDPRHRPARAG